MIKRIFSILAVCAMLIPFTAIAAELKVKVTNIKGKEGTIRVALWNKANGFPNGAHPFAVLSVPAKTGSQFLIFKGLKPGIYAVSLFHDKNKNEKLDTNLFGAPQEGIAFSNNVVGSFGPPTFNAAALQVKTIDLKTEISIIY